MVNFVKGKIPPQEYKIKQVSAKHFPIFNVSDLCSEGSPSLDRSIDYPDYVYRCFPSIRPGEFWNSVSKQAITAYSR
jgi:hypothetical protein